MTYEEAIEEIKEEMCRCCRYNQENCSECAYGIAIEVIRRQVQMKHEIKLRMSPFGCLMRALWMCDIDITDEKGAEVAGKLMKLLKDNGYLKERNNDI